MIKELNTCDKFCICKLGQEEEWAEQIDLVDTIILY